MALEIVERNINDLIPAEYNPRWISDEAFEQLKASIKRFDAVEPIVVNMHPDRENIVISGHQRLRAAKALDMDSFPCVEVELTREQERELNIRMNKNTGDWDWDELANQFNSEELEEWGFTDEELFGDDLEMPDELTEESEQKDAVIKITFDSPDHLEDAIPFIEELLEKYPDSFMSVSAGEL